MLEIIVTAKDSSVSSFGTTKTEKSFISWAKKEMKSAHFTKKSYEIARITNAISSVESAKIEMCKLFNLSSIELKVLAKGGESQFARENANCACPC